MKKMIFPILLLSFQGMANNGIDSIFHWDDPTMVGSLAYDNAFNEVWGFTEQGKEYGVIGSTFGTHIFDLSNPDSIYEAAIIPGAVQGATIIHRDYQEFSF